jgi:hypothetical protein
MFEQQIKSLSDVKEFLQYLNKHDKLYHPDDSANTVGNTVDGVWVDTFTEVESVLYDLQMSKSVLLCNSADVDIYDLIMMIENTLTIKDIKEAIDIGKKVLLYNGTYEVIKDRIGQYLIHCKSNDNYIGLHGMVGTRYEKITNYPIADFYIEA